MISFGVIAHLNQKKYIIKEKIIMLTKGKMIKALKSAGIRKGEKNGAFVSLEHLKTCEVTKLYYDNCITE